MNELVALPRSFVAMKERRWDRDEFVNAVRAGRLFISTGPVIDLTVNSAGIGETVQGKKITLRQHVLLFHAQCVNSRTESVRQMARPRRPRRPAACTPPRAAPGRWPAVVIPSARIALGAVVFRAQELQELRTSGVNDGGEIRLANPASSPAGGTETDRGRTCCAERIF
jgi:hypothetical protein